MPGFAASVLDAMPIGLYVVDRGLTVVAWNRAREKGPFGQPRGQVLGRPLKKVLPARGFKDTLPILKKVFESGDIHEQTVEAHGGLYHVRRLPVKKGRARDPRALGLRGHHRAARARDAPHRLRPPGLPGPARGRGGPRGLEPPGRHRGLRRGPGLPGPEAGRREGPRRRPACSATSSATRSRAASASSGSCSTRPGPTPAPAPTSTPPWAPPCGSSSGTPPSPGSRSRPCCPPACPRPRIDADSLKQVVMALAMNAGRGHARRGHPHLPGPEGPRGASSSTSSTPARACPEALRSRIFEPYFTTDPGTGAGPGPGRGAQPRAQHGGDLVYVPRAKGSAFRVVMKAAGNA